MITLAQYFGGRDETYKNELTEEIVNNATELLERVNRLLADAAREGVPDEWVVSSGWRPPSYNATVPNAAVKSRHMTGQAIDIADPDGELDEWLLLYPQMLGVHGLSMEHPAATKGWCHLQSVPPKSGRAVFYP